MGASSPTPLRQEDVDTLKARIPQIDLISGAVRGNRTVTFSGQSTQTSILGVEPQMAIIRNATKMHSGQWFTNEDNVMQRQVAVLGYQVYDTLFGGDTAVGATIRVGGQNYEVVGVVDYKGGSGFMNPDDQIYIPLETAAKRLFGKQNLDQISVQVMSSDILVVTQTQIEDVLAEKRRNASGENLFRVFNQGEMLEQIQTQTRLLSLLLAGIASVSLLVGGIGIMNIMLVSVTERTREIGLRKAIGAKRESILTQFLLESVVMCLGGGVIGIMVGYAGVVLVAGALKVPPTLNLQAVGLAFGFSAMVGVFFGLYPALRASRLEPIQALRHE